MRHLLPFLLILTMGIAGAELQVLYTLQPSELHAATALQYSQMKYGDLAATQDFAEQLVEQITSTLPIEEGEWGVLTVTGKSAPTASSLLAALAADSLQCPLIPVKCLSTPAVSYSGLSCGQTRAQIVSGRFSLPKRLPDHVIFIDDAVASGAHVREFTKLVEAAGSKIYPFALYQIPTDQLALENLLNQAAITPTKLAQLIDNPDHPILLRTMKTALSYPSDTFEAMLDEISDSSLIEFNNAITREGLDHSPLYKENLIFLHRRVNERSRARKALELPPYQTLYLIQEQNAEQILAAEGQLYSRLKYGDLAVIDSYADQIAKRIELLASDLIRFHPSGYAIASAGYYRTPNAASYLADRIAQKLQLDRVDLRARGIFTGEFGAVADPKERERIVSDKLYVSNPEKVKDRIIFYIDDVYVSGAHLIEHSRLLAEAQASAILSFAVLDVASQDLTLEKALNYAIATSTSEEALHSVIQNDTNPVLTRAAKLVLRLDESSLKTFMAKCSDDRLFELVEASEAEGYPVQACFEQAFIQLQQEALARHSRRSKAQPPRLLLLDYDGTLAEVLSPLKPNMMEKLLSLLEEGAQIAIVTMQPLGERGLMDFTMQPLLDHMRRQGKDLKLLQGLHLMPCGGMEYYQIKADGSVDERDPVYNVGLQLEQKRWLEGLVEETVGNIASKIYFRKGYVSTHYPNEESRMKAKALLDEALKEHPRLTTVLHSRPWVMHVRVKDLSKVVARSYAMRHLRHGCTRAQILVAGDRMGSGESDSEMFVYGATNLALGEKARIGAEFYPDGLLAYLNKKKGAR